MPRSTRLLTLALATTLLSGMFMTGTSSAAEVLNNGGFEAGEAGWDKIDDLAGSATLAPGPEDGDTAANFCAVGGGECLGAYTQEYVVPSNVTSATFSFWYYALTSDIEPNCDDQVAGGIAGTETDPGQATGTCSESAVTGQWTERTLDVTSYLQARAGETLTVGVQGASRYDGPQQGTDEFDTVWYVDDVSLDVVTDGGTVIRFPRTVDLMLRRHVAKGAVLPGDPPAPGPCIVGMDLKVQKRRADGTWKTIKTTTTDDTGSYQTTIPHKAGRYRVMAPRLEVSPTEVCLQAISPVRRHRH